MPFIYIHVPKCGGSTFASALRGRYFYSQSTIRLNAGDTSKTGKARILSDYDARAKQLKCLVQAKTKMIAGHVQYCPKLHAQEARQYRFITLLREPVMRFVSHFEYLKRRHPNPERPERIEEFLETDEARWLAEQYLFYFAGPHADLETNRDVAREGAIANLNHFELVGDLDALTLFRRRLFVMTGLPPIYWKRNTAPKPHIISNELRERICDLCADDMAIYRHYQARCEAA